MEKIISSFSTKDFSVKLGLHYESWLAKFKEIDNWWKFNEQGWGEIKNIEALAWINYWELIMQKKFILKFLIE